MTPLLAVLFNFAVAGFVGGITNHYAIKMLFHPRWKLVISKWIDSYKKLSFYVWAVTLKGNAEPIGAFGLFVVNENDLCGDVGYCLGKRYWGQRIATEAVQAEEKSISGIEDSNMYSILKEDFKRKGETKQ